MNIDKQEVQGLIIFCNEFMNQKKEAGEVNYELVELLYSEIEKLDKLIHSKEVLSSNDSTFVTLADSLKNKYSSNEYWDSFYYARAKYQIAKAEMQLKNFN